MPDKLKNLLLFFELLYLRTLILDLPDNDLESWYNDVYEDLYKVALALQKDAFNHKDFFGYEHVRKHVHKLTPYFGYLQ